jgi:hypothetical protein
VNPVISLAVIAPAAPRVTVKNGLAKKVGSIADKTISFLFFRLTPMHIRIEKRIPIKIEYRYKITTYFLFLSLCEITR